ncbi:unnamed protein product [Cladocopium goreaui]|uniref:3'(2'),5'-bisphosphate nucleotidase 1 n=1 Tax=Cladocopium goreaui TaxID=2562237 RepID=A0A9P1BHU1_9DINO|nr:unnamed protein product [Cladocopium goreaui]
MVTMAGYAEGPAEMAEHISLKGLVSQCVDLAQRAGELIRAVSDNKSECGIGTHDKGLGTGNFDPQTLADRQAQRCIVENLRAIYGSQLRIVGEEGELGVEADGEEIVIRRPSETLLDQEWPGDLRLPLAELCVWVDPLDGTKEFTQGRYEYVSTLIGISQNGHPVAGVISEPYSQGQPGPGRLLWGCCLRDSKGTVPGVHVLGDPHWRRPTRPPGRCVAVISRSRASGEVGDALQRLTEPGTAPKEGTEGEDLSTPVELGDLPLITGTQQVGGAGHKVARVVDGAADLWLFPRGGTSRWDSCAAEAMLEACGGALRNRFGQRIFYDPDGTMENSEGVLAAASVGILSAAAQVCGTLDVARDLQDRPLSREWLEGALQLPSGHLKAFTVTSCQRSGQCCDLRLALRYAGAQDGLPTTLSFKRSWEKSMEPRIFEKFGDRLLQGAGVRLPRVFCNMSRETEADGSSATSILLMEDLSAAPFRRCTNSLDDLKLATTALAQFHAATMGEKDFLAELSKEGFVAENLTQAALDSWQEIVKLVAETPEEAARWSIEIADLVSGLASCAKATATQPGSEALCLIHGDFRSDHVIIEGKEVILMAFSHAKVATPALDLASLVTSSQSFASLNQLLDLYCQLLPAQSMAELRQSVRLACLQLALKPMEVKPPLDSRKLRLWVDFLWTLLNEMDAR